VLKTSVIDLETRGWVRVYGDPEYHTYLFEGDRLTPEQRLQLDRLGHTVGDDE